MQVLYEQGAPDWNRPPHPPDPAAATPFPLQPGPSLLPRLEPSQAGQGPESAAGLFQEISRDGRSLGTRVHELLSQVEWGHDMDVEAMLAEAGEDPASEAAAHVRQAVASGALDRPTQAHTAWREKKFETVLPTGWVTGIFDRVVLLENEAWIQDFKTNRSTGPDIVDHYRPQMDLYRTVLADMLNLPPENIRCQLVFTRTGEVAEI
jgi:ATP-dependent exoDNAse (exonuclease V) beta subunit